MFSVEFIHLALLFGSADGGGMLGPDAPLTICLGGGRNLPGITSGQFVSQGWQHRKIPRLLNNPKRADVDTTDQPKKSNPKRADVDTTDQPKKSNPKRADVDTTDQSKKSNPKRADVDTTDQPTKEQT
ncbi:E3 ubiquitin-protein ligase rnf213-like isoform x4 [Plakobranchus ocellatus]|uniref:E3 ubiquitin-protein ligase rnf213-like isoform x4 n=1 Tax=Plakobranchus ocellatus TaxID=259542 RepID=A0AAV4B7J5_9GAST|nr:E3 ubiquitin-protein ligase rnf213-like isoform x4 [Plakobranchus ocellatus]